MGAYVDVCAGTFEWITLTASRFWAFLYVQNRHDVCEYHRIKLRRFLLIFLPPVPVQNYITAIIVFLIVEQLLTWGFYGKFALATIACLVILICTDYQNRHGFDAVAKVWLVIVSILNAGRNSFSFFLLLIVCMGYGVVKPTLGKTMIYVRFLALAHFAFGVIYAVASLSITPDNAGPLVLLVILPLAATLTAFYVWTLNSLNLTMKDLLHRKQTVKAMMYKKLWWCVLGSIMVIFGFFFVNSFTFAGRSDPDFVPDHWQTRWFILDGWLNLVYFFDIAFVAYLWRPTANNRRFAMSDEVSPLCLGAQDILLMRDRSHKMMRASKLLLSAARLMRKMGMPRRRLNRKPQTVVLIDLYLRCRRNQSVRPNARGSL